MNASSLKKYLGFLLIGALLLPQAAFAQQSTLLPNAEEELSVDDCEQMLQEADDLKALFDAPESRETYMSCAIKTGAIHLWMLPYFISYFADFFLGIAGLISVLFVLLGGFWYMTGGVTDDKEKGKKTITYALMGLVLTLLAWIIVNVLQVQVTR
jgi:hypothetical protein